MKKQNMIKKEANMNEDTKTTRWAKKEGRRNQRIKTKRNSTKKRT